MGEGPTFVSWTYAFKHPRRLFYLISFAGYLLQGVDEHDGKGGDGDEDGNGADAVEHQKSKRVPIHLHILLLIIELLLPPLPLHGTLDARRSAGSPLLHRSPHRVVL